MGVYCINHNTLGADHNATLAYDLGSELHRPTMIIIGGHGGQLDIYCPSVLKLHTYT